MAGRTKAPNGFAAPGSKTISRPRGRGKSSAAYGKYLTTEAQQARLARLLWEQRTSDARTTAALVGQAERALADARIQLIAGSNKASTALSQVPAPLRADPGLLYDQVRYERRRGNEHTALPLLLTAPTEPTAMVRPETWWVERKILARKALAEGMYMQAYQIAAGNGLSEGVDFAEAEFMAGWVALQYLNKPDLAIGHFRKLSAGVSTPISKSRAEYWSGRAASAKGEKEEGGEILLGGRILSDDLLRSACDSSPGERRQASASR